LTLLAQARAVPLLLRVLAGLPPRLVVEALGVAGLLQACVEPTYVRRVVRWIRRVAPEGRSRARIALALLRNRGRFLAIAAWPSLMDPDAFERRTVVKGLEHLEAARRRGGAILLGFHLGPGIAGQVLARAGHPSVTVAAGWRFRRWPSRRPSWGPGIGRRSALIPLDGHDALARAVVLQRVRRLLLAGAVLRITADGAFGDVAFPIMLEGEQFTVRKGWWALRRQTGASVLPVLTSVVGDRVVVTVHPPLPAPDPDPETDLVACQGALEALLGAYVRRFPDQCLGIFRAGTGSAETAPASVAAPDRRSPGLVGCGAPPDRGRPPDMSERSEHGRT
jgi:lauroyl/myristoyl acyltransferase